jgi:NAD(P)-dependent dehydrogenase (short-subunit alcohol dehydrogenase family)
MSNQLTHKTALVTGGSRGIGAAIVRRISHDGAAVAFTYSASEDRANALAAEIKAAGGRALPIKADSADNGAVKQAVAMTAKTYGGLRAVDELGLKPVIDATYAFEDAPHAFEHLKRGPFGKVVVRVAPAKASYGAELDPSSLISTPYGRIS